MAREVRTPLCETPAVELGNKIWWKQVLPANRKIRYEDREIEFDEAYCRAGAEAFERRGHDTQPFVLAGETNSHTMAAQNGRHGEVLAAKVDMDAKHPETGEPAPGLYYALRLSDDADEIVRANPRFGVSLRMKENWTRSDGEHFDVAPQHCLGTWDPVLNGLSPWQPYDGQAGIDLSNTPDTTVIDLSGLAFDTKEGPVPAATSTDTEIPAWFQGLVDSGAITVNDPAAVAAPEADGAQTDEVTADDITAMTDEQFDAWWTESGLGDIEAGDPEDEGDEPGEDDQPTEDDDQGESGQGGEVQASQTGAAVELANGDAQTVELAQANAKVIELSKRVNASEYLTERDRISRTLGIPPAWIDTVRPLLEGTDDAVQLSNGDPNPGHYVRNLLRAVGEGMKVLDLSESQGELLYPADTEEQEKAKERSERAARFAAEIG